ncbi:hypothetical protein RIF29_07018 [Crotalaria pallida]|uniref:Uncharacterized protein n=1 Tax=Crotalaria pallida TaxID=3830 RepID=A0AAN9J431_CROPI
MNSKSNQSKSSSSSLNNFNFDFDLGISSSNRPKSLNDHKNPIPSSSYYSTPSSQPRPAWQPNKPSWTHQPNSTPTGLPAGPVSMVGDIFGKTWGSQPSTTTPIAIINKNPNLFGDLVTSALGGQPPNQKTSNVPLKNASNKTSSPFSMGHVAHSLPKTAPQTQTSATWGSSANFAAAGVGVGVRPNLGGPSINSGSGISSNNNNNNNNNNNKRDPFSSLGVGIGSNKPPATLNSSAQKQPVKNESVSVDDGFGDFQNAASKPTSAAATNAFPSSGGAGIDIDFSGFAAAASNQSTPVQASGGGDPMDMFFSASVSAGGQASSGMDDWGLESDGFGGHDDAGSTTELEGLPPPPAGVSGSTAKGKGMDSYKQGQFADAIKWLSWAVILLEKTGDNLATAEVLSSRASCYKEVGEYKKAVADCTKVLEGDETNVSVLVQRALLYESMEKYKLGAEDLRTVLRIDPGNRIAKSTVHRLAKMAD